MKTRSPLLLLVLLCTGIEANAQMAIDTIFVSPVGQRPASIFHDTFETSNLDRFDLNRNGTLDMVVLRDDEEGRPVELIVHDLIRLDSIFVFTLVGLDQYSLIADGSVHFRGFFDMDNDGFRDAVFGGDGVAIYGGRGNDWFSLGVEFQYVGIADLNDDNVQDLIVGNTLRRRTEVYSHSGVSSGKRAAAFSSH